MSTGGGPFYTTRRGAAALPVLFCHLSYSCFMLLLRFSITITQVSSSGACTRNQLSLARRLPRRLKPEPWRTASRHETAVRLRDSEPKTKTKRQCPETVLKSWIHRCPASPRWTVSGMVFSPTPTSALSAKVFLFRRRFLVASACCNVLLSCKPNACAYHGFQEMFRHPPPPPAIRAVMTGSMRRPRPLASSLLQDPRCALWRSTQLVCSAHQRIH